jgi:uncharacterized protein YtpQ (UPF0354 family)
MKIFLQVLLVAVGLCAGCSRSDVLGPGEFTREFAEALRKASPERTVTIVGDLEVKVRSADGRDWTSFLDNAYDLYKQAPDEKDEVIERFVTSYLESFEGLKADSAEVDRSRIVPVIKDAPWLEETRQALLTRGAKETPEHVWEEFCPGLIVVYAEDSPKNIRYLAPGDLEKAKIEKAELRKIACENLERLLPKIERRGTNGFYMITAGGAYEASLLVLDSIWSGGEMEVKGDVVVAIPTRDLLLVTGSADAKGIAEVREMVKQAMAEGTYRLTEKLFVYRNGKFAELREGPDQVF